MTKSVTLPQDMSHHSMVNTVVMIVALFSKVSIQCDHGDVRLVNGSVPNEGRVEVCVSSIWGTVCDAVEWGREDAEVVCRQLGYTPDEAIAKPGSYYGQGEGPVWLDNVRCNLTKDMTLLECPHRPMPKMVCTHARDAGVRCRDDRGEAKNVSAMIVNPMHTVMISWSLGNSTHAGVPTMFEIECFSEKHSIAISVSNQTLTVNLGGLLSSTSYTCCVSVVYENYTARRICTETVTTKTTITEERASNSSNVVEGVLGFIITVLLVLLVLLVILVIYLLRPHWKEKLSRIMARLPESQSVNQSNTMDMPVRSNLSYVTTPSHSTRATSQAISTGATIANRDEAQCPDYSCIGPDYETIDSRRQSQRKNRAQARLLSERYEYSEAHLATDGGGATERSANYEVPLNLRQNECMEDEDYSHLQY